MSSVDPAKLSELIAAIYDCALDAGLWPTVLERVSREVGALHGALRVLDPRTRNLRLNVTWGGTPYWTDLYNTKYYALVPTLGKQLEMSLDVSANTDAMLDRNVFIESDFYREWAQPQGYNDVIGVQFLKQSDRVAWVSCYLPEPIHATDARQFEMMNLLSPHFRRAALIGDLLEMRSIEAAEFRTIVDHLTIAVLLVDEDLRLLHSNREANALIEEGHPLSLANGIVRTREPKMGAALRDIVRQLAADGTSISRAGSSIPVAYADGRPGVLHVLPQRTGSTRARIQSAAVAALFIAPRTGGLPTWRDVMTGLYDISPGEMRVLTPLVEGKSTTEIAGQLGIGEATLRTHLRMLYSKTGTSRQGELIALTNELSLPLRV